mgnify:CR=1 FL=1
MFFVLSKKKLCSYLVALGTVAILLSVSSCDKNELIVETKANIQTKNEIVSNIQNEIDSINYEKNEENKLK